MKKILYYLVPGFIAGCIIVFFNNCGQGIKSIKKQSSSSTVKYLPGVLSAPEWVLQIEPGVWAEIGKNTLSDVDPANDREVNIFYPSAPGWRDNQSAVIGAWNGGAYASGYGKYGSIILCGGGHADYYGNEVYSFDIETQIWSRLTNPYPYPKFPVENGIWPDNTPSVSHTYDQVDYHAQTNSFVMMKTQFDNTGGKSSPIVAMFSLNNLELPINNENRNKNKSNWRFSKLNNLNYTNSGGWSVYDPLRDVFWAEGGSGTSALVKFDPKTSNSDNTYGEFQNYAYRVGITDAVGAYDPINDLALVTRFRLDTKSIVGIQLSNVDLGKTDNSVIIQAGEIPVDLKSAHGWEWSPSLKAFVYYRTGSRVYTLKQMGTNWRTDPWFWSQISKDSSVIAPAVRDDNGIYSRFKILTFKDAEIAILVNSVKGPVYVFRIL